MTQSCVEIKDLSLQLSSSSFEKVQILSNINLILPEPAVYGLIGPSGCGKTSLFRCLFGYFKPTTGSIKLFGHNIGDKLLGIPGPNFGYAAQENIITFDLSVYEMLYFSGRLASMSPGETRDRIKEVCGFFELNEPNKLVKDLSGGQSRRLAVACAILNRPPLLIMDEPTVSSDPSLRRKIWNLLQESAKNLQTTVIISTHYLEEVINADHISIMNKGTIIAQGSPLEIQRTHGVNTIEDALLHIFKITKDCKTNGQPHLYSKYQSSEDNMNLVQNSKPERFSIIRQKNRQSRLIVLKMLLYRMFHRRASTLLFPLLLNFILSIIPQFLYTVCIGKDPSGLHVGMLSEPGSGDITYSLFKEIQKQGLNVKIEKDFESAYRSVQNLETIGFGLIKSGFTPNFYRSLNERKITDSGAQLIGYYGDETNLFKSHYAKKIFERSYENINKKYAHELKILPIPTQFVNITAIYGALSNNKIWIGESRAALAISVIIYFGCGLGSTMFWIRDEKDDSFFERLKAAGVDWFTLTVCYVIAAAFVSIPAGQLSLTLTRFLLNFGNVSSDSLVRHGTIAALSFTGALSGLIIGTISTNSKVMSCILATGYLLSGMITAAIFTSINALPYFIAPLQNLFPILAGINAIVNNIVKRQNFLDPQVYTNMLFVIFHMISEFLIFTVIMKFSY